MKNPTYISPKLHIETKPDSEDIGIKETAEFHLATPFEECESSRRDFGVIVKKPNYVQKPISGLYDKQLVLDTNKPYVFSEMLLCLDPGTATVMMSHEGEILELVGVLGPDDVIYRTAYFPGCEKTSHSFRQGESFFSIRPKFPEPNQHRNREALVADSFEGFYHQLDNPNNILNLSHIILVAERQMAVKDGKLMRFGINRPPNTWWIL